MNLYFDMAVQRDHIKSSLRFKVTEPKSTLHTRNLYACQCHCLYIRFINDINYVSYLKGKIIPGSNCVCLFLTKSFCYLFTRCPNFNYDICGVVTLTIRICISGCDLMEPLCIRRRTSHKGADTRTDGKVTSEVCNFK